MEGRVITQMFKEKFDENKYLFAIRGSLIASIFCLIANIYNRTPHYFIKGEEGITLDASKRDFCVMAMNQMIHKKLSKKLVTSDLYTLVTEENYKNMFFEDEDKVTSIFSSDSKCKLLVKAKEGVRSFDFTLEESGDLEFFYQITKIHENDLYDKES